MQSALLFFLASTMAVSFGWQPMPDGSESYEYVVQLDREMLARLQRGESIPISADVPEEIQPIRRIRLVIGNEDLPRQKLVTSLKPQEKSQAAGDVVRGQYAESAPRYNSQPILPANSQPRQILPANNQPQQILPANRQTQQALDNFGATLQRTAQETRQTVEGARATVEQDILPRVNQVLPKQSNAILPRNSAQNSPNTIRNTNSSDDAAIAELFGQPGGNNRSRVQVADQRNASANNQQILPRGNTTDSRNTNTSNPRYGNVAPPANTRSIAPAKNTNPQTAATDNSIKAPWPENDRFKDSPMAQQYNEGVNRYATPGNGSATMPQKTVPQNSQPARPADPYRLATEPQQPGSSQPGNSLAFPRENAGFNNMADTTTPHLSVPAVPEIRRDMLNQPAGTELPLAADSRNTAVPASFSTPGNTQTTPTNTQTQPAGQQPVNNIVAQPQPQQQSPANSNTAMFPMVLAWVLLSGSGAGNLYMIWSYLDIRNKYRGLVRSAGRKLGRRYLDERYGEMDYDE